VGKVSSIHARRAKIPKERKKKKNRREEKRREENNTQEDEEEEECLVTSMIRYRGTVIMALKRISGRSGPVCDAIYDVAAFECGAKTKTVCASLLLVRPRNPVSPENCRSSRCTTARFMTVSW